MEKTLTIETSKTALVVIDLQKGIVAMDTKPHASKDVIGNAAKLANAFRANHMPVFLVRVTPTADKKDSLTPVTDSESTWRDFPEGFADIVPEMGPEETDFVITKRQWGAFYGTELDLQLRRRGIDTIVLCGISTNIGVESTARDAFERGYNQIFVEDATSASSAEDHTFAMEKTFTRLGKVRSTQEVLDASWTPQM